MAQILSHACIIRLYISIVLIFSYLPLQIYTLFQSQHFNQNTSKVLITKTGKCVTKCWNLNLKVCLVAFLELVLWTPNQKCSQYPLGVSGWPEKEKAIHIFDTKYHLWRETGVTIYTTTSPDILHLGQEIKPESVSFVDEETPKKLVWGL